MSTAPLPISAFTMWLAQGERGLSSEAIVTHLTGVTVGRSSGIWGVDYPRDPSDFRRCERLLRQVPLARLTFTSMRSASPVWAALVDVWDELVALSQEEAPGLIDDPNPRGSAPRLYARMRQVIEGAERAA